MFHRGPQPGSGDKSSFFLRGSGRGVLCLHGFTGTPFEVRPLAEALGDSGFTVGVPALAGHCGTREDLALTRWPDWLASAEVALDRLLEATGRAPVGIIGFSMGGLIALRLTRLRPRDVAALVVMSAPLRLRALEIAAARALSLLPRRFRRGPLAMFPKLNGFDVVDEEMRRQNPGLPVLPVAGVVSMMELAAVVRRDLPSITVPTLVAHGERDRTVPFGDSLELVGSLASDVIERLWLPRSGHLLAIDVERFTLIDTVERFLAAHVPSPSAASEISP